jgi:hypothetical protein
MMWFIEDPTRSRQERRLLEELVGSVDWLNPLGWRIDDSARLVWDADLTVGSEIRKISLRFPNNFPYSPPLVLPRDKDAYWTLHQYGRGGELCLEYGPDNWRETISGADMVQSAYRLLAGEMGEARGGPPVPSRHVTTIGASVRGNYLRYVFDLEAQAYLESLPEGTVSVGSELNLWQGSGITKLLWDAKSPEWKNPMLSKALDRNGFRLEVAIVKLPAGAHQIIPKTASALLNELQSSSLGVGDARTIVLLQGEKILAVEIDRNADTVESIAVIRQPKSASRLSEEHKALSQKRAAIIGCGSLGSKIAVSLARSGVRSFVLVDEDILLPENTVRNDLDWRDVGNHKVDSVATKIELVQPTAAPTKYRRTLGGQGSSGAIEGLLDILADCDLIVDATAEPAVFNVLSSIAKMSAKPAIVWGEVFGGGIGGMMARYRSLLEPGPLTMRQRIDSWCASQGAPIPETVIPYGTDEGDPHIADDTDVSTIAGLMASFSVDTLLHREPSHYPFSAYLIGLRPAWIFSQALEVRPIDVGAPDEMIRSPVDPEAIKEELLTIAELLGKHRDANSSGT